MKLLANLEVQMILLASIIGAFIYESSHVATQIMYIIPGEDRSEFLAMSKFLIVLAGISSVVGLTIKLENTNSGLFRLGSMALVICSLITLTMAMVYQAEVRGPSFLPFLLTSITTAMWFCILVAAFFRYLLTNWSYSLPIKLIVIIIAVSISMVVLQLVLLIPYFRLVHFWFLIAIVGGVLIWLVLKGRQHHSTD